MESDRDDSTRACINEFITLANTMKDRGISITDVSWSLMNASAIYSTYSVSGNTGGLKAVSYTHLTLPTKRIV